MTTTLCTYSVFADSEREALVYKWIESEKAGHDLGEAAVKEWVRNHWWGYLRARWIEHLEGRRFWLELDRNDFGLLQCQFKDVEGLMGEILRQIKEGKENLDIINWALDRKEPMEQVLRVLEGLDINSRRLSCKFE
ncbi:MAG TPA: hypothetical protein PKD86_02125 [Gemmatales bacterium]|nr:hypothetical protein [Gemmatales bacterium]HMP58126.1 hypothetical protein [Gemmatales bacterium]